MEISIIKEQIYYIHIINNSENEETVKFKCKITYKMAPIEIQQLQQQMAVPNQNQAGSIPLSSLIQFIVQRTYHDLTVLSEL